MCCSVLVGAGGHPVTLAFFLHLRWLLGIGLRLVPIEPSCLPPPPKSMTVLCLSIYVFSRGPQRCHTFPAGVLPASCGFIPATL